MLRTQLVQHLRDPFSFLKKIKKFLVKNGLLIIMVPNDFNPLQLCANKLGFKKWWIRIPDHVNYFNFASIDMLLKKARFKTLYQTTDFPMEIFLLMGENYVDNEKIGKICHKKRMLIEKNLDSNIRRTLYQSLAKKGIGRTCITYAKNLL